jgi:hypothetical protein
MKLKKKHFNFINYFKKTNINKNKPNLKEKQIKGLF